VNQFKEEWRLLVAAREWFSARGYRLIDSRGPEGMDQGFDVYLGDRLGIRLVADRGSWDVEVHPATEGLLAWGSQQWFNMEAWSTCLGEPVLFHDADPPLTGEDWAELLAHSWRLEPQLAYLRATLPAIEAACSPERIDATLACLGAASAREELADDPSAEFSPPHPVYRRLHRGVRFEPESVWAELEEYLCAGTWRSAHFDAQDLVEDLMFWHADAFFDRVESLVSRCPSAREVVAWAHVGGVAGDGVDRFHRLQDRLRADLEAEAALRRRSISVAFAVALIAAVSALVLCVARRRTPGRTGPSQREVPG